TEYCDYVEQVTTDTETGRLRPDMVVHLPNGREVIVDAKAPAGGYLDAMAATTERDRREALRRHAQQVRQHMNALAAKAYQEEFAKSADFVVMFISGESFAAAAAHATAGDRKSTRLNSSHGSISYAVFCLKKKTKRGARMAQ